MRRLGLLLGGIVAASGAARAQTVITVTGGVEESVNPVISRAFKLVYPGQVFASVGVPSAPAANGFLNNDCTFGILANCSWSPLGAGSPVDLAVTVIPLTAAQVTAYDQAVAAREGPPIQFPVYGVPVAIGVKNSAITVNGKTVLGDGELCGIFSGVLTDWSQFDPFVSPGPFHIVYDSDAGSGMTWLLTQHLHAVCDATNSAFTTLPVPVTGNFAQLPIPGGVAGNPRFVAGAGNAGVAAAIAASSSAIGYLGANFTSEYAKSPVTSTVVVAALFNSHNATAYTPSAANVTTALSHPGPSATNAAPPATAATAADPTRWVPAVPDPVSGYPIVGYASWILSTCYTYDSVAILDYLTMPDHASTIAGIVAAEGFVTLTQASPAYASAVASTLTGNTSGFNLNLQNATVCGGRVAEPPVRPGQG